ncbi:MAG: ATP-binding protein [Saprospiraceae bacterium]|nr:ATP-binding protein [Saprospiraceae bacterium]
MMIARLLLPTLQSYLSNQKALLIIGPRQTGKTTLVKNLTQDYKGPSLYLNADELLVRERLSDASTERLREIIGQAQLIVIDEAQRVKNIGLTLKLIVDQLPQVKVIATGSSALDLANEINEPLTGRKFEFNLLPVSWQEWSAHVGALQAESGLEQRLLYGMYPDVLNNPGGEQRILANLVSSYLYKDLLSLGQVRKPVILENLLQALSLQLGNEVSYNELSNLLSVSKDTVMHYIDLLEKAFVIFRLHPLRRNLRQELTTSRKIYFYDTGIRNALIGNFNPLKLRNDTGALWENFLLSERMKKNHYAGRLFVRSYFWRLIQGGEIDYVEEDSGRFSAFEFKWNPSRKGKYPKAFQEAYPDSSFVTVTPDNFMGFIG